MKKRRLTTCALSLLAAAGLADVPAVRAQDPGPRISGFVSEELAYTIDEPMRWSRAVTRLQLNIEGRLGEEVKYKLGGRVDVDPVYAASNFYLDPVKEDQRFSAFWRENYIDFSAGDLAFRVGAQNIIWGEVAGLFFADVVSARDQRDFLLPSFDVIRIPQWAVRTEYFAGDAHFELIWIPVPTVDNIGKPGADFYPVPLSARPTATEASQFLDPLRPDRGIDNGNYGLRGGTLVDGWDVAAFYYRSYSVTPTFYLVAGSPGQASAVLQPRHDRIWQAGTTVTKDLGSYVVRAEAVYAGGQNFASFDPLASEGVVARNTLDWIVSAERPFEAFDGRVNLQVFQRLYFGGSGDQLALDTGDWGASVLISGKLGPRWEPSLQWLQIFGGGGSLVRPKISWLPAPNLALGFGVDIFSGDRNGFFGRYADKDRVYAELRFSF